MRSLFELADAKNCTVGELTGTRRRYSKVSLPDRLARFVGADELVFEHYDEGVSVNEIPYWSAFWSVKKDEQKHKGR
jgi:hypothetical protein